MASPQAKHHGSSRRAACVEDVDENDVPIQGSRRSANIAKKRSHTPPLRVNTDVASDSGYGTGATETPSVLEFKDVQVWSKMPERGSKSTTSTSTRFIVDEAGVTQEAQVPRHVSRTRSVSRSGHQSDLQGRTTSVTPGVTTRQVNKDELQFSSSRQEPQTSSSRPPKVHGPPPAASAYFRPSPDEPQAMPPRRQATVVTVTNSSTSSRTAHSPAVTTTPAAPTTARPAAQTTPAPATSTRAAAGSTRARATPQPAAARPATSGPTRHVRFAPTSAQGPARAAPYVVPSAAVSGSMPMPPSPGLFSPWQFLTPGQYGPVQTTGPYVVQTPAPMYTLPVRPAPPQVPVMQPAPIPVQGMYQYPPQPIMTGNPGYYGYPQPVVRSPVLTATNVQYVDYAVPSPMVSPVSPVQYTFQQASQAVVPASAQVTQPTRTTADPANEAVRYVTSRAGGSALQRRSSTREEPTRIRIARGGEIRIRASQDTEITLQRGTRQAETRESRSRAERSVANQVVQAVAGSSSAAQTADNAIAAPTSSAVTETRRRRAQSSAPALRRSRH